MDRAPAVAAAACFVIAALQFTGNAQASDYRAPPPPPPPGSIPWLQGLRLEGGVGYNTGTRDTTISSPGIGSLSTDLIGGDGLAAQGAAWFDTRLMPVSILSVGAQYLRFNSGGSISATSSMGPIFGLTSASADLKLDTDAVMLNAAWRAPMGGLYPFIGAGVGVAFQELSGSALGVSATKSRTDIAGQVFAGLDFDIGSNIYAGVTGRWFISDSTYNLDVGGVPVAVEVTNRPISLMGHLGMRF